MQKQSTSQIFLPPIDPVCPREKSQIGLALDKPNFKEGKSAINLSNLGKFAKFGPAIYLCEAGWRSRKLFMLGRLAVPKTLQILGKILS